MIRQQMTQTLARHLTTLALGTLLISGCSMKEMMVQERQSPYGLDETVERISNNAKELGWSVSGVKELDKSIKKNGGPQVAPVRLVELCNAQHAGQLMLDDASRYSSVMMPCTISVYTKSDGKTYVSNMRADKTGSAMGGLVADVMQNVSADQEKILKFLPQ